MRTDEIIKALRCHKYQTESQCLSGCYKCNVAAGKDIPLSVALTKATDLIESLTAELDKRDKEIERYRAKGWISVEERLPEKHGWYLVVYSNRVIQMKFDGDWVCVAPLCVTNWRPIPELPEKGTEK